MSELLRLAEVFGGFVVFGWLYSLKLRVYASGAFA